jgi:DNA-binding transcriptional regulator YhcF (GntR family)
MRIYMSNIDRIRQTLQDPLFANQSITAISRFLGIHYRTVFGEYKLLLAAGLIAKKQPTALMLMTARGREVEPQIVTMLLDPKWQARSIIAIAEALGVSKGVVYNRYKQLRDDGLVPARKGTVPADGRRPPRQAAGKNTVRLTEVEPEVMAILLDPSTQTQSYRQIAARLGVSFHYVRSRYNRLVAEGLVPKRSVNGPRSPAAAAKRRPWPRSSSA